MSVLEQLFFAIAGWFADHSYPALAGLIGGIVGGELRERWRARRNKTKERDARG